MRISTRSVHAGMLGNYFKTAVRNLVKNKFFATINVFALALGMSISLIFIATLLFVFRYDNFHPKKERIYRVITHLRDNQNNPSFCSAPVGLAQLLQQDVAGLENVVRINGSMYVNAIPASDKSMAGTRGSSRIPVEGYFADPEFLTVFNFPLAQGDPSSALEKPNSIVLMKEAAIKIFGTKDPLGDIITLEPSGEFMVTGVFAEVPPNSHMNFEAVVSYSTLLADNGSAFVEREENWKHFINSYVYFLVDEKTTTTDGIQQYLDRVANTKYTEQDYKVSFELQRLDKIVPGPMLYNSIGPSWDYLAMTLVGLLMMIILIPACANYVTLAISQSLRRMKEIGVRKVMGGLKKQIFMQFVTETCITMVLALILAYIFFELIRGEALQYIGDKIDLNPTLLTYLGFIVFALFVGFVAGIVPALYFAKIAPLTALKGKEAKTTKRGGFPFRKIVITTQFMLSLGFITAVMMVLSQYHYSTNYNLGFEQQNVLDVELQNSDPQLLKNEFGKMSSVQIISLSSHPLATGFNKGYVKTSDYLDSIETSSISIDENFISLMKLELLRGNNFTDNHPANTRFIIINEEFAKALNPEDPSSSIDKVVKLPDGREVRIGGIIKNFHYDNLKNPIRSFYFEYNPHDFQFANIKLQSGSDTKGNLDQNERKRMEMTWKKINATDPFLAQLLSDEIGNAYKYYFDIIKLWSFLGLLAITVSCLGLLGTVVFTIRTRVKEISLRKVMGASSENLVMLLSKDFVILMVIASVITIPVVWLVLGQMLSHMQYYSVELGFFEVVISISILFFIGLTTVLSQTLRAANMNPVDNLRVE